MDMVTLGRTGLKTTIAGLGGGGHSRLGYKKYGESHAASIVRAAFDAGVNFFDTSVTYGTEPVIREGLEGITRDRYILSTKLPYRGKTAPELMQTLEQSLSLLKTDYIDIYHLHGLDASDYPYARGELIPAMLKARDQGKIRFLGVTEAFIKDTRHEMLELVLPDDVFDVIMVGYNLLNPSAARLILPRARAQRVGVLCMFAVRSALSNPEKLKEAIQKILESGQANPALLSRDEDLSFLTQPGVANSVMEAAYRFCRHTDGIDVVLIGTGEREHLTDNLRSLQEPALPVAALEKLNRLFGNVDCVNGQ
jgi:L-galactose dehydrogenase